MKAKTKTKTVPVAACDFHLAEQLVDVQLADAPATGDSSGGGRFEISALSGKPILNHWYWGNLGVDLEGIKGKAKVPVLVDHDVGLRIGVSDERNIDPRRGLVMSGAFLQNSALAQQVRAESKDGFPWEASVRLLPLKLEQVPEGATADVNGQQMKGPGYVFRRSQLREVSFTALGADSNTAAAALSESSPGLAVELTLATNEELTMDEEEKQKAEEARLAAEQKAAAEQAKLNATKIREEAIKSERERVATIRSSAMPEQAALVEELIVGGAEASAAQIKLGEDLRTRFRTLMANFGGGDRPLSGGNRDNGEQTKLAEVRAMPEGRERWAREFELDAKLRDEIGHKDAYLAMRELQLANWNPARVRRRDENGQPLRFAPFDEVALAAGSPAAPITISGVRAGYAMALQQALGVSWARDIATVAPTSSPSETWPWLRAVPNPRKWEGERTVQELRSDVVTIVNDDYEATIEFRVPDLRRDKTGQIMARAADLATRVAFFPEGLITTLLTANGNAYDGTAFFATTHSVGSSGTINNAIVAADGLAGGAAPTTAQQSANLLLLLSKQLAFLDDQGQPLNEAARQFVVMVPASLYGATVAAINAMFTSASATNPLGELARYGYSFRPVLNARLTTTNVFYMLRADAGIRSLLLQEEGVNPVELGPDSEHAKKTNKVLFGHGWAGGAGYGRFELAIRGTTS